MTPETAKLLIERERAYSPHLVKLARHLSLALRIETELLRAMRLRVISGVEAGIEADLFFSPLVQSRDVNAITLISEVRNALHQELAKHKDELETAREVIEAAHHDMDAVILLEEQVTYYDLRDDHAAYNAMQGQLGSIIRELSTDQPDYDLVYWAESAYPRLPDRARSSQAGRMLSRQLGSSLARLGGLTQAMETTFATDDKLLESPIRIGFQATPKGVRLCNPSLPGWTALDITEGDPAHIEMAWPLDSGWQRRMVELHKDAQPIELDEVPLGLVRLRGISGDEIKLRIKGPFTELQPKLLTLYRSTKPVLPRFIEGELEDLEWQQQGLPLRDYEQPMIFISHSWRDEAAKSHIDELESLLYSSSMAIWSDDQLPISEEWNRKIKEIITSCQSAVVVLSESSFESNHLELELTLLEWRERVDPAFRLHVLLVDISTEAAKEILVGFKTSEFVKYLWHSEPKSVAQSLFDQFADERHVEEGGLAACLLSFPDWESQSKYIEGIDTNRVQIMQPLIESVEQLLPVLLCAGDDILRLDYESHFEAATEDSDQIYQFHYQQALRDAFGQFRLDLDSRKPEHTDRQQILRSILLEAEQNVISGWLEHTIRPPLTDDVPEMVYIPGGTLIMGDENGRDNEKPKHEVYLEAFLIGRTPVTVGEYRRFVEATGYPTEAEQGDGSVVYNRGKWRRKENASWRRPFLEQDDRHPVVCVSWNDAQAYCKWLSENTGQTYCLLSEAQWEYACRAGSVTAYWFGDDDERLDDFAWYSRNAGDGTRAVCEKASNQWGLCDMNGNCWEWCSDWYRRYTSDTEQDPDGPESGLNRVLRGGSWSSDANYCRSAYRNNRPSSYRASYLGFRVARTPSVPVGGVDDADNNRNATRACIHHEFERAWGAPAPEEEWYGIESDSSSEVVVYRCKKCGFEKYEIQLR